jgi:hypothetical protein
MMIGLSCISYFFVKQHNNGSHQVNSTASKASLVCGLCGRLARSGSLLCVDRYRLLRGTRAARSDTTDSRSIHRGPLRLVKHESPRVSNGAKTALHGAAQQAIRIPSVLTGFSAFTL